MALELCVYIVRRQLDPAPEYSHQSWRPSQSSSIHTKTGDNSAT